MGDVTTWSQRFPMWDVYFGVVALVTAVIVAAAGRAPLGARGWAVTLLAGMLVWYLAYGRPLMRTETEDRRGYVYLAGVLLLYVPAVVLVSASSYALMALCPQAYMLMSAVRATIAVVILNVVQVLVAFAKTRDVADTVAGPLPVALMVILTSVVFGTWARRVSIQNDERARLIDELAGSRAEVSRLSHEAGALAERQRLAGDIHDTLAQGLSSVIMLIQAAEADLDRDSARARRHLDLAVDTARDNLAEARALVGALTPADLGEALARIVDRFARETDTPAGLTVDGTLTGLPTAVEVVLLRTVQESLANVRQHAKASTVSVRVRRSTDGVRVEVTDDGCGFTAGAGPGGYGLAAMRARVSQVAGRLSVDSVPGGGTTVRVEVANL